MFMRPWEEGGPWDPKGIEGVHRWLHRVWTVVTEPAPAAGRAASEAATEREVRHRTHATIKRVTEDLEQFRFNTAIAALMEFTNFLQGVKAMPATSGKVWDEAIQALLLMLAPLVPHIAEELWTRTGRPYSIHQQAWPKYDASLARAEMVTLVIQVNGKVRDRVQVRTDISEADAKRLALESEKVGKFLDGRPVAEVIVVPGRLVNVVVR